jgi:hypothetical protein
VAAAPPALVYAAESASRGEDGAETRLADVVVRQAEPVEPIHAALTSTPPTPAHRDVAAELFTCFE